MERFVTEAAGYAAWADGVPREFCPHPAGVEREWWVAAWDQADEGERDG